MTLSTESKEIPKGKIWTEILNTKDSFSVQNTANVLLEYSFTDGIDFGSYLVPYEVLNGIRQSVYVRFNDNDLSNGLVSITRETI